MAKIERYCSVVGCDNVAADKHHVGGASSPMIWICKECHGRIHGVAWRSDHGHLTREGLAKAKAKGRVGGNPGVRAGDPEAIKKIKDANAARHLEQLVVGSEEWLPTVQRMRPGQPWGDVVRDLNRRGGGSIQWTVERLRRSVRRLVSEGLVEAA